MKDVEQWRERDRRLHTNFEHLLGHEQGAQVAYHLGDIRDAAANLIEIIDQLALADPPLDRQATLKGFHKILGEFDDHLLPNHVTPLRALLDPLIDELYASEDDTDEEDSSDVGGSKSR